MRPSLRPVPVFVASALIAPLLLAQGCSKETSSEGGGVDMPRGGSFKPSPPGKYEYKSPPAADQ